MRRRRRIQTTGGSGHSTAGTTRRSRGRRHGWWWLAGSAVGVGALLVYLVYHLPYPAARSSASASSQASSPGLRHAPAGGPGSPEAIAILAQAARQRFAGATPRVIGPDGKPRTVTDSRQIQALELVHFKQLLVGEELARNPGLAEQADANLREGRPAVVRVEWQSPAGGESVEKIIADTVACGLAELDAPARLSFQQLQQTSCLYDDDPLYWDTVGTHVTVSTTPIDEDDIDWERLRDKEMRDIAAMMFVQRVLQAQQQE